MIDNQNRNTIFDTITGLILIRKTDPMAFDTSTQDLFLETWRQELERTDPRHWDHEAVKSLYATAMRLDESYKTLEATLEQEVSLSSRVVDFQYPPNAPSLDYPLLYIELCYTKTPFP